MLYLWHYNTGPITYNTLDVIDWTLRILQGKHYQHQIQWNLSYRV